MDENHINGMLAALQSQRDQAMNGVVALHGRVAVLEARVKELEAELQPKENTEGEGNAPTLPTS